MRSLGREFIIIAILVCLGMGFSLATGRSPLPWAAPEIGPGEIRLIDAKALDLIWVDARNEEDFAKAHIPEAILLNEENWDTGLINLMEAWLSIPRPMVIYCADASCGTSKKIAERLREALPEAEIYTLKGGWESWE
ncbi:MAG: rhodanese-like domain-containing protein [Verrucomicrobiota bacterium]